MSKTAKDSGAPTHIPRITKPGTGELMVADIVAGSEPLVAAEMAALRGDRDHLPTGHCRDQLMGLALSGGGIRSATFGLGVMQSLAVAKSNDGKRILEKMDYLSTVSGGGFIGSSLTWHLRPDSGETLDLGANFPYGPPGQKPKDENKNPARRLRFLRQHGNYLTPGAGITLISGIAVVLRAMLLNLLVWLPVLVLAMAGLVWLSDWMAARWGKTLALLPGFAADGEGLGGAAGDAAAFLFVVILAFGALLAVIFILACAGYSIFTAKPRGRGWWRYRVRRLFEQWGAIVLTWTAVAAVFGSVPLATYLLRESGMQYAGVAGGPLAVLIGLGVAIRSFFKAGEKVRGLVPDNVLAGIGAAFLIYGLALTAYAAGKSLVIDASWWPEGGILVALAVVAVVTGLVVNLNYISLHRYYRDRLMEAFLPNSQAALANVTGPASDADPFRMSAAFDFAAPRAMYHLVNTNLVLVDSKNRRRMIRGGDSFLLSPLFCGSNATGWQRTDLFNGDSMTLATAMAISGAAANPNTGVGGVGLTRDRAVSLLMALLNLRLGYWTANPRCGGTKCRRPQHFRPGLYDVFGGLREDKAFLQLSDGGHFENLAVYELIRRKLRLIIVCDGGADPGFAFGDLQNMVHRIDVDFGARLEFDHVNRPDLLVADTPMTFPVGGKSAPQGHIKGTITYADGGHGTLVLMKTTMIADLGIELNGYKGAHPEFPDESTADQFFDENQFEAYRQLGATIAEKMVDGVKLADLIASIEAPPSP